MSTLFILPTAYHTPHFQITALNEKFLTSQFRLNRLKVYG